MKDEEEEEEVFPLLKTPSASSLFPILPLTPPTIPSNLYGQPVAYSLILPRVIPQDDALGIS